MRLTNVAITDHPRPATRASFDRDARAVSWGLIPPSEQVPVAGDHYTWGSWDPLLIDVDGNNEIAAIEILRLPTQPLAESLGEYLKGKTIVPARLAFEDTVEQEFAQIYEGDENGFLLRVAEHIPERYYATHENVVLGITRDNRVSEIVYLGSGYRLV